MWRVWLILILFFNLLLVQLQMVAGHQGITVSPEGCEISECGGIEIPYPFGIGPNCYANPFFDITCKNNSIPLLTKLDLEVLDLTSGFHKNKIYVRYPIVNVCGRNSNISSIHPVMPLSKVTKFSPNSPPSPYRLLPANMVAIGCNTQVAILTTDGYILPLSSCIIPTCDIFFGSLQTSSCTVSLPYLYVSQASFEIGLGGRSGCVSVNLTNSIDSDPATSLLWSSEDVVLKSDHSNCTLTIEQDTGTKTEICYCQYQYRGNPYILNGCQAPEECNGCQGDCVVDYYFHNATWDEDPNQIRYRCDQSKPSVHLALVTGLSTSIGSVLFVVLVGYSLYRLMKRMKEKRRRLKNFEGNGGLLLQQHMNTIEHGCGVEKISIFTEKELAKASNNFHKDRVLGHGGQGTVFKGILSSGKVVAIKKAKIDGKQSEEFINEVVILSRINHRNVVKLIGCCLDAEAPLLVYEYVPNGMLSQHIHKPRGDFYMSWEMRMQIAVEIAGALAYLHSSSSTPIYHRDIKSSNILLDEKYRAKIADFGISRIVSIDQTHLTTNVVGTFGYLDLEYFHSHQFTEKSDVYSFGVVLLELLTSKEAILGGDSDEPKSLSMQFLVQMESSKLFEILDPCIVNKNKEELLAVANLASRCLNKVGEERPTMKEIAVTLDGIKSQQPWSLGRISEDIENRLCEACQPHNCIHLLPFHSCPPSFFIDV